MNEYSVESLEELNDDFGDPLAIKEFMKNKLIRKRENEFKGKYLLLDDSKLEEITSRQQNS